MSVKQLIESARNENAAEFEKIFESVIAEKIADALTAFKRDIVAKQFGVVSENDDMEDCDDDDKEEMKNKKKSDKAEEENED